MLNYLLHCLQSIANPQPCKATALSLDGLVSRLEYALAGLARPLHHLHQSCEDEVRHIIFQWLSGLCMLVLYYLVVYFTHLCSFLSIYMRFFVLYSPFSLLRHLLLTRSFQTGLNTYCMLTAVFELVQCD